MVDYSLLDENFFVDLYDIGFVIISPIICIIGLILNILCCIVFFSLKEKIFFYLGFKALAECLFLMIGAISPYIICYDCDLNNTYFRMLVILVANKFLKMAVFLVISILEIEIAFNRYNLINSHNTKTLIEKKDKIKILIYLIICILIYVPCFFAYEIKRMMPFAYEYILVQNKMGNNLIFIYFYSCFNLIADILSILILLPLNIIILLKFNKFIKNKSQNTTRSTTINRSHLSTIMNQDNNRNRTVLLQENTKTETRFTRMIVSISFFFIFSRLCQAAVSIIVIYNELIDYSIKYFKFSYTILNIFGIIFTNLMFSFNFLIFYFFNNTFRKKFDLIFCCKK
jgi:hypothetical protein